MVVWLQRHQPIDAVGSTGTDLIARTFEVRCAGEPVSQLRTAVDRGGISICAAALCCATVWYVISSYPKRPSNRPAPSLIETRSQLLGRPVVRKQTVNDRYVCHSRTSFFRQPFGMLRNRSS
ncbi:hypothetical protein, partial [Paraburkholderia sediminicola]|uniref:hypothetical protein n=1 Tax=Paraburkholderia sediminicola TaxID=458836 RepID=UPI0038BD36CF